ncbi:hypothetical protein Pyn_39901 [Prunus yedoensis var. nudiflora]|uniref:Uncharacterized protein n=1 Tax=Prunus yedoensis var. nudiflora TaxID=2094558 RepID=A0A314XIB7_PRUYE|nr:hypothetical protein Pyn_39901 [Prunus yedoensis var. nudiflora]
MVSNEIYSETSAAEVEGYCALKLTVDSAVKYLQLANKLFSQGELFHFCASILELVIPVYKSRRAYGRLNSRQVKADVQPGVCYLQITAVDSVMEDEDLGSRRERIFSLSTGSVCARVFERFLFDTPFTKNGKTQSGLEDQWNGIFKFIPRSCEQAFGYQIGIA